MYDVDKLGLMKPELSSSIAESLNCKLCLDTSSTAALHQSNKLKLLSFCHFCR